MSISGGVDCAFGRAVEAGCDCMQVFVKNQRQWQSPLIDDNTVHAWQRAAEKTGVAPIIAHDSYLINLASPDDGLWNKSIDAFVDEQEKCERLGIGWLVAHPGSHVGQGEQWGIKRIARALDIIHKRTKGFKVKAALETTAGQGTSVGHRFEHLAEIMGRVKDVDRLGVCFDTCHVFAAGYDIVSPAGYQASISELDEHVGLSNVSCFHLNDSKKPMGSRVDRHEHIGKGHMGLRPFRSLINDERFFGIPMILETPKGEDERGRDLDRVNLSTLRRLVRRSE